jgi:hypothetical protein
MNFVVDDVLAVIVALTVEIIWMKESVETIILFTISRLCEFLFCLEILKL